MKAIIEIRENDTLGTLRALLRSMLEKGVVDALLVPQRVPSGDNIVQTLVRDPQHIETTDPISPVMPVQSATLVANLTGNMPVGENIPRLRLGAVLKSCEIRALIELAKLKQARLDDVVIIGIDCLGTYEVRDYAALVSEGVPLTAEALVAAREGRVVPHGEYQFRAACQMCEFPIPANADIAIGLIGVENGILLDVKDELAERLGLSPATEPAGRNNAVGRLVADRIARRDAVISEFRHRVVDMPSLLAEFSRCIRCYNCMVACPICYCKQCLFQGPTFDHDSDVYYLRAGRQGVIRMPTDTLLFHLTRMNHMVTSCVGCGLCTSACPSQLPVGTIFRAVGQKVQALFDYQPGRSLDEELPLATFHEDELTDLGEG